MSGDLYCFAFYFMTVKYCMYAFLGVSVFLYLQK